MDNIISEGYKIPISLNKEMTSMETLESLCKMMHQISITIRYGDLLPESIEKLREIQSELQTMLEHQNEWWSIQNCNEI